jgi:hypothetical protein
MTATHQLGGSRTGRVCRHTWRSVTVCGRRRTIRGHRGLSSPRRRAGAAPAVELASNVFRREGEYWSVAYAGRLVRIRDTKGIRDIARLIAADGAELLALELVTESAPAAGHRDGEATDAGLHVEQGSGELLDAEARRQYRERLAELADEYQEAERCHDPERASRAREEKEFILHELGSCLGLGGRARRVSDPVERARKAVSWRVRDAIDRIAALHADLGRHLRHSVRTGAYCRYDPPEPVAWML